MSGEISSAGTGMGTVGCGGMEGGGEGCLMGDVWARLSSGVGEGCLIGEVGHVSFQVLESGIPELSSEEAV